MLFLYAKARAAALLLVATCLFSCQSIYYASKSSPQSTALSQVGSEFNLFLIGDAGAPASPKGRLALDYMRELLQSPAVNQPEKVAVIFLGDNVYPKGMPDADASGRKAAEDALKPSLELAKSCLGRKIFIPGNHDWYSELKHEVDYIHSQSPDFEFLPENNCPGPVVAIRNPNFTVIILDTQWYLNNSVYGRNSCSLPDSVFWKNLTDTLNACQSKPIILLGHHPLVSNGPHGGRYRWLEHLFPLTQINHHLYIPLPILGTALCLSRKWVGHNTDLSHPRYREFRHQMIQLLGNYPNIHYVAGHDHNLQFHQLTPKKLGTKHLVSHTVSGAGSKTTYITRKNQASFAAAKRGFVQITISKNKNVLTIYDAEAKVILYQTVF